SEIRRAIADLDQEAWTYRKEERRPLHHEFIRQARRHPFRLGLVDPLTPPQSNISVLTRVIALARALRPRWEGQPAVGIMLPASVAGAIVNLAAALSGRT